ncbi:probable membrane-associated kinase regulator 1 [Triticum dicoccoides]|uniref:probable membrane-associated kinase regulator 1 n=1 Tax=Triticum dicoccoides TaxID=85692 RepID=UPI00189060B5|nr:probable membrane-associated kinase regulator 1 [Triticum dicoccoides]XP_037469554.1 probable membrane-associated kinase regulator 1 [Triticum dicoccoides]
MGRARAKDAGYGGVKSFPSPASSSASSSEFEFTVTQSPGSKQRSAAQLCPADDLFYKGQLLPLHLSPRISMVRTLLLASASASASDSTSTSNSSRDSNGSTSSSFSTDCAALLLPDSAPSSSRPSSATDDDRHLNLLRGTASYAGLPPAKRTGKQYLSSFATRFSSVFLHRGGAPAAKKPSNKSLAKEVIKKYAKKVKPLYEKLSQIPKNQNNGGSNQPQPQPPAQQQQCFKKPFSFSIRKKRGDEDNAAASAAAAAAEVSTCKYAHSNSFSGNLRFPRQKRCAASCPSSMRSSPNHSGMLSFGGAGGVGFPDVPAAAAAAMTSSIGMRPVSLSAASSSSMEELQSAIEGAIAHCKNTMGGVVSLCPRKVPAATAAGEISAF